MIRKLDAEDRALIRAVYAEHIAARRRLVEIDDQMLALLAERDAVEQAAAATNVKALAEKFEASTSTVFYIIHPRRGQHETTHHRNFVAATDRAIRNARLPHSVGAQPRNH